MQQVGRPDNVGIGRGIVAEILATKAALLLELSVAFVRGT